MSSTDEDCDWRTDVEQMKMLVKVSAAEWKAIVASSAAKYEALSKGLNHPPCFPSALTDASLLPDVTISLQF